MLKVTGDPFAKNRPLACALPSESLQQWVASIRTNPGLFVFGVMVRSGTQYLTNLLALHPHLHRHPRDIWELPLLTQTGPLLDVSEAFLDRYKYNRDRLGKNDLLTLLGTAVISYLQSGMESTKRALLTHPSAEYLDHFFAFFPQEHLLLLMRDGRDVVSSVVKTWPTWPFENAAQIWSANAQMMLKTRDLMLAENRKVFYCKYEDALANSESFVRTVCIAFGLDPEVYPYNKIHSHVKVKGSSQFDEAQRWKADQSPQHFHPVGRWHEWTEAQKKTFKQIAGQSLVDCGYETSNNW